MENYIRNTIDVYIDTFYQEWVINIAILTEHIGVPAVSSRVDSFPLRADVPEAVESTQFGVAPEHADESVPHTHAPEVHLLCVSSVQLLEVH